MPRQPRLHVTGAFYHVMARGNRKQQVFYENEDYMAYLRLMRRYSKRYTVEIHGYALMPNHVHMLVRMGDTPLAKFMQGLQQSYTQYFNKAHRTVGHVFQGRYKCIYVDKDEYLLELIRYIHLNPVKDGLVNEPTKYRWSSHSCYYHNQVSMVYTAYIKSLLAEYGGTVIDDYQLVPEAISRAEDGPGVGPLEVPKKHLLNLRPDLDDIINKLCFTMRLEPGLVRGSGRVQQAVVARRIFAYLACRLAGYQLRDVADYLNCSIVTVSKSIKWVEETLLTEQGRTLADNIEGVRLKLI